MRNGFGWWRLAKQVVLGTAEAVASAAQSTFTLNAYLIDVSGTTTLTADGVVNDSGGDPMEGVAVSDTLSACTINGATCTVSVSAAEIEDDGADSCTLTIHVYDTQTGATVPDIATARFSLSGTTGLTVTPFDSATGVVGSHRWTITSTTPDDYVIGATVDGVSITDTAALTVSGVPLGTWTPLLQSDWSTATGVTSNAIGDGGIYSLSTDFEDNGIVIAAPAGFDSTNALEVGSDGTRSGFLDLSGALPEMVSGEVRNFRIKVQNDHPTAAEGSTDNGHHGWQDGGGGGVQNWNLTDSTNFVGEWEPKILINAFYSYYIGSVGSPVRLDKGVPYTFEVQMEGTSSTQFTLKAWVYDADGTLLYGPSDFVTNQAPYAGTSLATGSVYTYNYLPGTTSIHVGCNGDGNSNWPTRSLYATWGEHAVVSSEDNAGLTSGTTIGPYGSVTGE